MSVISTTMCYPSPAAPTQGIFVQYRLREVHRLMALKVVAPVPWFPLPGGVWHRSVGGSIEEPPVWRPPMFYLPGLLKALDGRFYGRAFQRGLSRAMGGTRPSLIDAHFVWPDGVGAWRVARKLGVPLVCTIRGKLVSQIVNRSKRRQIREMLLGADGLIAVSRSLADLADDVAGRSLGVRVIPNGVDGQVFHLFDADGRGRPPSPEARAACGWSDDAKYVVSVGHLQALKGFDRLVEIWPEVRRRIGDVRLVLVGGEVGEPGYARRLRRQIEAAGLGPTDDQSRDRLGAVPASAVDPGRERPGVLGVGRRTAPAGGTTVVTMAGREEPGRVATLLNAADLFVLASRSEGWCNAIAESLACGCPVVATDVGGNREIVTGPTLGRLVPLGDRDSLVEAVCGALTQRWDRAGIARAGGQRGWQQVGRECVDVFESLL
jgi:glycosyltransferase involved in cell wall biosynthesis